MRVEYSREVDDRIAPLHSTLERFIVHTVQGSICVSFLGCELPGWRKVDGDDGVAVGERCVYDRRADVSGPAGYRDCERGM